MMDYITISGLRVATLIGVYEEERIAPQSLEFTLRIYPASPLAGTNDELENTIDYGAVCQSIRKMCANKDYKLLEALAEDVILALLDQYPIRKLALEIKKFIIPDCEYVSVFLEKEKK